MIDPKLLLPYIDQSLSLFSRIHLSHYLSNENTEVYIKRDDELSSMISGSKYRKYSGLIPSLKKQSIKNCILIGSGFSNHIVGLSQLLIEAQISAYAVLLTKEHQPLIGNALFIKAILPKDQILELSQKDWNDRFEIAKKYFCNLKHQIILDEGGDTLGSVIGAMTIGIDLQKQGPFDHIFVDAGSGLSAIGLLLSLNFLSYMPKIHVVSMAISKEDFNIKYQTYLSEVEKLFKCSLKTCGFEFHRAYPKSFGATSPALFRKLVEVTRNDGIFFDPIYGIKLYKKVEEYTRNCQSQSKILMIHSGGLQSLAGFQEQLKKAIAQEEQTFFSNNTVHNHR